MSVAFKVHHMVFFFLFFLMMVTIYPIALFRLDVDFWDTLYIQAINYLCTKSVPSF